MNLNELCRYNLHDSLLENIYWDDKMHILCLEIDFCNWQQHNFCQGDDETYMITLIFKGVSSVVIPNFPLNSDQIVEFKLLTDKVVAIETYNDITQDCHEIIIEANSVEIEKL